MVGKSPRAEGIHTRQGGKVRESAALGPGRQSEVYSTEGRRGVTGRGQTGSLGPDQEGF